MNEGTNFWRRKLSMLRKEFLELFAKHVRIAKRGYVREDVINSITYRSGCPFSNQNLKLGKLAESVYERLWSSKTYDLASLYFIDHYMSGRLRKQMIAVVNREWKEKKN
jgi:hypothetical protein